MTIVRHADSNEAGKFNSNLRSRALIVLEDYTAMHWWSFDLDP